LHFDGMTPLESSLEARLCQDFLTRTEDEASLDLISAESLAETALFAVEGFEERSVGVLEMLANKACVSELVIARYDEHRGPNTKFRKRFDRAARKLAPSHWRTVHNTNDGSWFLQELSNIKSTRILFDITGASNRSLFGLLDAAVSSGREVLIAYSEAGEYWPTQNDWRTLRRELVAPDDLARVVDEKPWLFGYQHRCELVKGHEGYDSAGSARSLVAFLPFKPARLASVIGEEEYSAFVYVAGRPRLPENEWRLKALIEINADLTRGQRVLTMDTFGYRKAFKQLTDILFVEPALLNNFDVHLAPLGSKLQVVACWALSSIIRSVTVVTSVPLKYFPEAFSEGIGERWVVRLVAPIANKPV